MKLLVIVDALLIVCLFCAVAITAINRINEDYIGNMPLPIAHEEQISDKIQ